MNASQTFLVPSEPRCARNKQSLNILLLLSDVVLVHLYHHLPAPRNVSAIQGSHASWKVLGFFLENSRTWKVMEKHFGPGKSWKLKLKVLESPGKISSKITHFFIGSNGKQAEIVNVPVCVDFYLLK